MRIAVMFLAGCGLSADVGPGATGTAQPPRGEPPPIALPTATHGAPVTMEAFAVFPTAGEMWRIEETCEATGSPFGAIPHSYAVVELSSTTVRLSGREVASLTDGAAPESVLDRLGSRLHMLGCGDPGVRAACAWGPAGGPWLLVAADRSVPARTVMDVVDLAIEAGFRPAIQVVDADTDGRRPRQIDRIPRPAAFDVDVVDGELSFVPSADRTLGEADSLADELEWRQPALVRLFPDAATDYTELVSAIDHLYGVGVPCVRLRDPEVPPYVPSSHEVAVDDAVRSYRLSDEVTVLEVLPAPEVMTGFRATPGSSYETYPMLAGHECRVPPDAPRVVPAVVLGTVAGIGGGTVVVDEPTVEGRGISPREIRDVLRSAMGLRACYERERLREPGLEGVQTVRYVITWDGQVGDATTLRSSGSGRLDACIEGEIADISFSSRSRGRVVVRQNIRFTEE